MSSPGTLRFGQVNSKPSAPPVGYDLIYVKTDDVVYVQDSSGVEVPLGTASGITSLTGDVTATGPGAAAAIVDFVGGQSASAVAAAASAVAAATSSNTPNTLVERDSSGNFSSNITSLNALKLLGSTSGTLTIATPTTFTSYALTLPTTFGTANQALTTDGTGVLSWSSLLSTSLSDGRIFIGNGSNIATPQTPSGDISMTETGVFTVQKIQGSSVSTSTPTDAEFLVWSNIATKYIPVSISGDASMTATGDLTVLALQGNAVSSTVPIDAQLLLWNSSSSKWVPQSMSGDATITDLGILSIPTATVTGKLLTGYTTGTNTPIIATNSILTAFENLQAQVSATVGAAITSLTGDVSASGPGAAAATVLKIQGSAISSTPPTDAQLLIWNSTLNQWIPKSFSGDISITDAGVTSISSTTVTGKLLTGYTTGSNTPIIATNSILTAFENLQAQVTFITNAGVTTIGSYDSQAPSANGAVISGNDIYFQSSSTSNPGMVNNTIQSFSGNKTFTGQTAITNTSTTALTVNGTSLVVDATNNAIGIGIVPATSAVIDAVNNSGSTKAVQLTGYGSNVGVRGRFANGTQLSPTAAIAGNILEFISGRGYGATGFASASTGVMSIVAGATFTDTSMPTYLSFSVTPTGSVTSAEAMRLNYTGNLLVGTGTDNATDMLQVNAGIISAYNKLAGSTSGYIEFLPTSTVTNYSLTWPSAQGAANTIPTNNGSGLLSWLAPVVSSNSALTNGDIWIGNASNVATAVLMSGDATIANTGVVTLSTTAVTGKLLTGYVVGTNTPITATNSILTAFENLQAQVSATVGSAITALTGDGTATGPGSSVFTLATVNSSVGSFGSSTSIPSFTVNGKGLITAASSNVVIAPAGTLTGTTLASNVVSSSLTSVGTITSGVWNGTALTAPYMLALPTADIYVGNGSNQPAAVSMSGDVNIVTSGATTIQPNVVSNSKLAQVPANTLKGNNTGSTANVTDLTTSQVNTMLGTVTTIGTYDSQTSQANGLDIIGNTLYAQSATISNPGMVNATTQSFAGNKTFTGTIAISPSSTSALTIDTTSFIFDSTNSAFGIGMQPSTAVAIDIINSSGTSKPIQITSYGTGSTNVFHGRMARGTSGSPTATQSGDLLGVLSARGYGASQFAAASTGIINIVAGENFTNTSNLTYLQFQTTPTGSVTAAESMRVASTGVTLGPQSSSTAIHQINGGTAGTTRTITSSTFTVDTTTTDYIIYTDSTSNAITITLPAPTNGRALIIEDSTAKASTNNITINPHASEKINGASTFIISQNYGCVRLTSDGTNWFVQNIVPNVASTIQPVITLTESGGATTINWAVGNMFTLTLNANLTVNFSNQIAGQTIVVRFTNTASNYTVTWPTTRWPAGTAPTMSTGAVSDVYTFLYDGSNTYGSYVQNMS